ncbi:hypothetical protein CY34DRAFT_648600 [Suillus luteus UH-Slu-Lm8-n1]|uniref:Uncharacterized protein n=1 Tax=Suillus luteus UH-Slu-Lm8-n1 TaxID=930992 RepID=A0A0D0B2H1_9AGAM|nr:hypothetical protein CY34DRAFT_648600 [Suillus luteus UH-Slu-Lm8-n1]
MMMWLLAMAECREAQKLLPPPWSRGTLLAPPTLQPPSSTRIVLSLILPRTATDLCYFVPKLRGIITHRSNFKIRVLTLVRFFLYLYYVNSLNYTLQHEFASRMWLGNLR